jgi:hypothetical protein
VVRVTVLFHTSTFCKFSYIISCFCFVLKVGVRAAQRRNHEDIDESWGPAYGSGRERIDSG